MQCAIVPGGMPWDWMGLGANLLFRWRDDAGLRRPYARMTYREAVDVLRAAPASAVSAYQTAFCQSLQRVPAHTASCLSFRHACVQPFSSPPAFGDGLGIEHERYLAEVYHKRPVFVTDYPAAIKPFYMRCNEDGETVACMDLLVPHAGELAGGSAREERPEVLKARLQEFGWCIAFCRSHRGGRGGFLPRNLS